jgi:hypothetical protein
MTTENCYGYCCQEKDVILQRITMPCECKIESISVGINDTLKLGDVIEVSYRIIRAEQ